MPALVIVTNLYQYIIALYGLHKVSVIDFGKKVLLIKVTEKKISSA